MKVKVIPRASRFGVSVREGKMVIKVRAPAEGGRASLELQKELGNLLGVKVRLLKGLKSREKEISFEGLEDEEAGRKLKDYAGVAEPGQKK